MSTFSPDDLVFARPQLHVEALVHHMSAWLHLVAPGPAAMNFTKLVAPLLQSFLQNPEVHRASARNPKLRGGMFVDLEDTAVERVERIVKALTDEQGPMKRLADGLDALDRLMTERPVGTALVPLYPEVPEVLRGFVELVYDLDDRARARLLERFLYRSEYYAESAQSLDLSLWTTDERPFVLTPRLGGPGHHLAAMPFKDPRIDQLFASATTGARFGDLCAAFGVGAERTADFGRFFASEPDLAADRDFAGEGVRFRHFGHACLVIQAGGKTIVTDPFISSNPQEGRYTFRDLPDVIDYCIITHGHQDHLELGSLLRLRHKIKTLIVPKTTSGTILDPSPKLMLEALGFPHVIDAEVGDTFELAGGSIVTCPFVGEHCDLDIGGKVTYAVRRGDTSIYVGADCRGVDPALFARLRELIGPMDIVLLGLECDGAPLTWLYGPLFTKRVDKKINRSRKLDSSNAKEAFDIVRELGGKRVFTYAMGREPWLQFVMATSYTDDCFQLTQVAELRRECAKIGVESADLVGASELFLP